MSEFVEAAANVIDDSQAEALTEKLHTYFAGKIVRKDLTKKIKEGANVPVYVLEYLLGMYCSSQDEDEIAEGVVMCPRLPNHFFVEKAAGFHSCIKGVEVIENAERFS